MNNIIPENTGPVRVKLVASLGYAGADHVDEIEIPRAEWDAMSKPERRQYLEAALQTHVENNNNSYFQVLGDDEDGAL